MREIHLLFLLCAITASMAMTLGNKDPHGYIHIRFGLWGWSLLSKLGADLRNKEFKTRPHLSITSNWDEKGCQSVDKDWRINNLGTIIRKVKVDSRGYPFGLFFDWCRNERIKKKLEQSSLSSFRDWFLPFVHMLALQHELLTSQPSTALVWAWFIHLRTPLCPHPIPPPHSSSTLSRA